MNEQIIEIKKDKYIVRRIIDKEWINKSTYKQICNRFNGTKILKDSAGIYFVADLIVDIPFIEINNSNIILFEEIIDATKKEQLYG